MKSRKSIELTGHYCKNIRILCLDHMSTIYCREEFSLTGNFCGDLKVLERRKSLHRYLKSRLADINESENLGVVTEQELIKGCIQEDKRSQKELFRLYGGRLLGICLRYARHRLEAEDILQDAFIKIFDNIASFEGKGSFDGWLRRIVVNTALKNYQKSSFQQEQIGLGEELDIPIDPVIYADLQEEELLRLIARLPDGYRVVFNLYAIEGYSHREIADTLEIKESTSRSQLVKARKLLQNMILQMQRVAV